MYNYGPGQSDPGGQVPDNSANSPYGSPQPQYPQQPNAYPQQQPQQPQDPNAYPQQPQNPSAYPQQPQVSPAAPQYSGGAAVPASPTAPVTGPGPLDPTMFGGPSPMLAVPPKKKGPAVPILAAVSALLLVGTVIFLVLFLSAKGDLTEARATIGENEEKLEDLESYKEEAEESSECVKLVEDLFDQLDASPDPEQLDSILDDMESTCQSS